MAEAYLFKLMLKINGFFGIIIIFINLIDRFWWGIALPFIDKYLLDELVEIYNNRIIGYTVFLLIGTQLGGKIFSNLLRTIGEILSEYTQNKATLYLDKEVMGLVADMDSSFFDDPANWDAIGVANQSKFTVCESIGWSVSKVTSIVSFIASGSVFLTMNPLLGLLLLATYIPGAIIDAKNKENMRAFSINTIPENRKKDYYHSLLTSAHTAKEVRLYNLVDYFKSKYNGEKIALLGINGSGKTTLVKLLLRFYKPDSGEILLNGLNIREYSKEAYSRIFGVCFQDFNRYALKLRDNVALSNIEERDNDKAIKYAASVSGVDRIAEDLDKNYDTELTREFDDNGAELSGGQWQKISIARAFFSDAPVIILDEPSSALDPEAELLEKNGRYAQLFKLQASKYV